MKVLKGFLSGGLMFTLIATLSACSDSKKSKGGSGETRAKMKPADAKSLLHHVAAISQIANKKRGSKNHSTKLNFVDVALATASNPSRAEVLPSEVVERTKQLEAAFVDPDDCQIVTDEPPMPHNSGSIKADIPNFKITIGGPKCAMYLEMEIRGKIVDQKISGTMHWKFKAIDLALHDSYDVQEATTYGTMNGTVLQDKEKVSMNMGLAFEGSGVSKTKGRFDWRVGLTAGMFFKIPQGGTSTLASSAQDNPVVTIPGMETTFSESHQLGIKGEVIFITRAVVMKDDKVTQVCSINHVQADCNEANELLAGLEIPGFENPNGPGYVAPHPGADVEKCTVNAYLKGQYPVENLRKRIESNQELPAPFSSTFSCQERAQKTMVPGQINVSFRPTPEMLEVEVAEPLPNYSFHIFYRVNGETEVLLADTDNYSYSLSCEKIEKAEQCL